MSTNGHGNTAENDLAADLESDTCIWGMSQLAGELELQTERGLPTTTNDPIVNNRYFHSSQGPPIGHGRGSGPPQSSKYAFPPSDPSSSSSARYPERPDHPHRPWAAVAATPAAAIGSSTKNAPLAETATTTTAAHGQESEGPPTSSAIPIPSNSRANSSGERYARNQRYGRWTNKNPRHGPADEWAEGLDEDPDAYGSAGPFGGEVTISPSSWPPRYCFNCGDCNHYYKKCPNPVTSYGMILYRLDKDVAGVATIRYLLIQRDYSPEFRSLITNFRYLEHQPEQIEHLSQFLTGLELRALGTYDYPTLYSKINRYYLQRRHSKHQQILNSILRQTELLHSAHQICKRLAALSSEGPSVNNTRPLEPDWGFPKGRRNKHNYENDIDCARREVHEETGLAPIDYTIISGLQPREIYKGTNDIYYQHNYYVGRVVNSLCPIFYNPLNAAQTCEIRKIGWFTYEEAMSMFRSYHSEKGEMLAAVHKTLLQLGVS